MNCPKCLIPLTIGERKNVEIDYCQTCRGIWLDAGELEKILNRSTTYNSNLHDREDQKESWWERIIDVFD